jgi:GT2 family glycosyltransferase
MSYHGSKNTTPRVIAIVVTYNRAVHLRVCLNALLKQTHEISEILVVDNASSDNTDTIVSEYIEQHPRIEYVRLPSNTGGSGGFHEGIRQILGREFDFAWLMDDDVAAEPNCLEHLLKYHTQFDVLQPVRRYDDHTFVISEPRYLNLTNPFRPLKEKIIEDSGNLAKTTEIAAVPFEGPLISKKALSKTGLPEYGYFIIADDTEYSIRLSRNGFKMVLVRDAILIRQIQPNPGDRNLSWKFVHHLKNHIHIDRKHGSTIVRWVRPILLTLYYIASSLLRRRDVESFKMICAAWRDR